MKLKKIKIHWRLHKYKWLYFNVSLSLENSNLKQTNSGQVALFV